MYEVKKIEEIQRDLLAYTAMLNHIQSKDPAIELVGLGGHTIIFEKNGKQFAHSIMTWQCAADPEHEGLEMEEVANMVVRSMKDW